MSGRTLKAKTAKTAKSTSAKLARNVTARRLKQTIVRVPSGKPRTRRPTIMGYLLFDKQTRKYVPVTLRAILSETGIVKYEIKPTTVPDGFEQLCPVCLTKKSGQCTQVCAEVQAVAADLICELGGTVVLRKTGDYMRVCYAGLVPTASGTYVFCLANGRDA
jgi:hypothetical protein